MIKNIKLVTKPNLFQSLWSESSPTRSSAITPVGTFPSLTQQTSSQFAPVQSQPIDLDADCFDSFDLNFDALETFEENNSITSGLNINNNGDFSKLNGDESGNDLDFFEKLLKDS